MVQPLILNNTTEDYPNFILKLPKEVFGILHSSDYPASPAILRPYTLDRAEVIHTACCFRKSSKTGTSHELTKINPSISRTPN
jgi:hypothetical protein